MENLFYKYSRLSRRVLSQDHRQSDSLSTDQQIADHMNSLLKVDEIGDIAANRDERYTNEVNIAISVYQNFFLILLFILV